MTESNKLEHSDVFLVTHSKDNCIGEVCSIHNRSNHSMRKFRQHWRSDRALMERICAHGIGHPDPDHMNSSRMYFGKKAAEAIGVHGCDGCCSKFR